MHLEMDCRNLGPSFHPTVWITPKWSMDNADTFTMRRSGTPGTLHLAVCTHWKPHMRGGGGQGPHENRAAFVRLLTIDAILIMELPCIKIKLAHFHSAKGKMVQNKKVKERKRLRDSKAKAMKAMSTEKETMAPPTQQCRIRSSEFERSQDSETHPFFIRLSKGSEV
jgi:hypothetical protein